MFSQGKSLKPCKMPPKAKHDDGNGEKEPISVFCRVRPLGAGKAGSCLSVMPPNMVRMSSSYTGKEMRYTFRQVFDCDASQKELFDSVALPLVTDVLNGKNALLFTYGVTGSGKTFTMTGSGANPGIMPRSLDVIFNSIYEKQADKFIFKPDKMNGFEVQSAADALSARQNEFLTRTTKPQKKMRKVDSDPDLVGRVMDDTTVKVPDGYIYSIFVTYIEIYNNTVYDLLEEAGEEKPRTLQRKITREDGAHNIYVHGVTEIEVTSTEEAFELFRFGLSRKRMAQTVLNSESSRSHSVFSIRLVQAPVGFSELSKDKVVSIAQLSMVDLAGSERTNRTGNTGQRLKEAGNINNSLMTLRTCLELLRENQSSGGNKMIPYREAKITHLFKNYFEGDGRVSMIVCVNPSEDDYDENLFVLKFAEMSQEVQVACPTQHKYNMGTPSRNEHKTLSVARRRKHDADSEETEGSYHSAPKKNEFRIKILSDLPEVVKKAFADSSMSDLIAYLETSKSQFDEFRSKLEKKESNFSKKFSRFIRDECCKASELKAYKSLLNKEQSKKSDIEAKLRITETNLGVMKRRYESGESQIKRLKREVHEKDNIIAQKEQESDKAKEQYSNKISKVKSEMKEELEKRYRSQKSQFEMEMKKKATKVAQMILSDESDQGSSMMTPSAKSSARPVPSSAHVIGSTRHYPAPPLTPSTPAPHFSRRMGIPVSNRRYRRSKSAGDVWLDHRPQNAVELNTVLQPKMEKRKSVTKLKDVKDLTQKSSKYCLTTQRQDSDGDLETRLYKGDILPTSGGGAQVMFNDVEVLKQESPSTPRYRRSKSVSEITYDMTRAAQFCSIGIEGHKQKN